MSAALAADRWRAAEIGRGRVRQDKGVVRLTLPPAGADCYHDAQICDYAPPSLRFVNGPPLRLSVEARAEGEIRGTAGFGFWNCSFEPGARRFRIPQALWFFFASPPSDMALALNQPGAGWKAATFDALNWRFLCLLPFAPLGFLLMRSAAIYRSAWPIGQRTLGVSETALDPALLADWHRYSIAWTRDGAEFRVDGGLALSSRHAPARALGFIAWIDNQYAIVTPQGRFGWGKLEIPGRQSLLLRDIEITSLA